MDEKGNYFIIRFVILFVNVHDFTINKRSYRLNINNRPITFMS